MGHYMRYADAVRHTSTFLEIRNPHRICHTAYKRASNKWSYGRGRGPPYPIVCTCYREASYRNHGNQQARRREIGMDTRNEMCKATKKGDK
jgi:hypothetical protein